MTTVFSFDKVPELKEAVEKIKTSEDPNITRYRYRPGTEVTVVFEIVDPEEALVMLSLGVIKGFYPGMVIKSIHGKNRGTDVANAVNSLRHLADQLEATLRS